MMADQNEAVLYPEWHPCLPNPSRDEVDGMVRELGFAEYSAWLASRTRRIQLADPTHRFHDGSLGEPFRFGFEPPHWKDADALVEEAIKGVYDAGGKRATKSYWAADRVVRACMAFPRGLVWCLQANERISRMAQQSLIWHYLPNEIKKLNGKARHGMAKVNYSVDGGFAGEVLVFPNESQIQFLTFKADPKGYQGVGIGFALRQAQHELMARDPRLHNIGAWLDEDCPILWLQTCDTRTTTNGAKVIWTFSTMEGITQAVAEVLGTPKTRVSRPAKYLEPNIKHVPDCPPGHMPFIQECTRTGWLAIYFHTELNPFGENHKNMAEMYRGKSFPIVAENLYGWSRDMRRKAWANFGPWNIVKPEEVPAEGTNYFYTDPAGSRNWASMWVRVCPGNPTRIYVYRDWPDEERYGQWAEPDPTLNPNPDGQAGRAQESLGLGYGRLKVTWMDLERIRVPDQVKELVLGADGVLRVGEGSGSPHPCPLPGGEGEAIGRLEAMVTRVVKDPYHRKRILEGVRDGEDLDCLQEVIFRRYIDPRAGRNAQVAENGGTCAIDELRKEHVVEGKTVGRMNFVAAPGLHIEDGIQGVTALLDWNRDEDLCPLINEPQLYVSSACKQVLWCLGNYTGKGGESGGCKDFADLLRYMATSKPKYLPPGAIEVTGGGSY